MSGTQFQMQSVHAYKICCAALCFEPKLRMECIASLERADMHLTGSGRGAWNTGRHQRATTPTYKNEQFHIESLLLHESEHTGVDGQSDSPGHHLDSHVTGS